MKLHNLTLKRARHHPSPQACLKQCILVSHQAAAVIPAPFLLDGTVQPMTGTERCVARSCAHQVGAPRWSVPTRGSHRVARLGFAGGATANTGQPPPHQQVSGTATRGQHWRFAQAVVAHFCDPNLQSAHVDAQVLFAPLASVLGPMLLVLPFVFAQNLMPVLSISSYSAIELGRQGSYTRVFSVVGTRC